MPRIIDRTSLLAILLLSCVPIATTSVVQFLPSQVALALAVWVLGSVPLGIGIGHCVLSGE